MAIVIVFVIILNFHKDKKSCRFLKEDNYLTFLSLLLLTTILEILIMKNNTIKYIAAVIIGLSFLTSCVSKKKFVEADTARISAQNRNDKLTKEVAALNNKLEEMKKDFNVMQSELRLSNAKKDAYIDSLSKNVVGLSKDISKKDESLSDQIFQFQSEKVQLNSALLQRQSMINELTLKLNEQENELAKLKQEIIDLKTGLSNQKLEIDTKGEAIFNLTDQTKKLESDIELYKKEIGTLKKLLKPKAAAK